MRLKTMLQLKHVKKYKMLFVMVRRRLVKKYEMSFMRSMRFEIEIEIENI
jgi:hypothetical protein